MRGIRNFILMFALAVSISALHGETEKTEEEIRTIREERTDILRFGIDTEVISLINTLIEEKNDQFCPLVLEQASKALNQDLIAAAFRLFQAVEYKDAQDLAVSILNDYDLYSNPVLSASMTYLEKDMSDEAAETILPLLKNEQAAISRIAVHALGLSGKKEYVQTLIDLLQDDDFHSEVKTTVLISLGDLGSAEALDILTDIAQDTEEEKAWRWYACQSLGKIGAEESFPVIRALMGDPDPTLRSFAAEAVGSYKTKEAEEMLVDALRDSFWKVRVSAAEQLGERGSDSAVPSLIYKAKNDPENNVKKEAITALGKIGSREGLEVLRELAGKKTTTPIIWAHTVTVLVENDLKDSFPVLEKMLADEWDANNSYFFDYIAKLLSNSEGSFLEPIFGRFLDHDSMIIKIYGIRGIEKNKITSLRDRVEKLSEEGNPRPLRQAALSALENL